METSVSALSRVFMQYRNWQDQYQYRLRLPMPSIGRPLLERAVTSGGSSLVRFELTREFHNE